MQGWSHHVMVPVRDITPPFGISLPSGFVVVFVVLGFMAVRCQLRSRLVVRILSVGFVAVRCQLGRVWLYASYRSVRGSEVPARVGTAGIAVRSFGRVQLHVEQQRSGFLVWPWSRQQSRPCRSRFGFGFGSRFNPSRFRSSELAQLSPSRCRSSQH